MSRKGVFDMAHTVNVNIKMDEDVKKRMERACAEMGLSMSAAFTTVSYTHLDVYKRQAWATMTIEKGRAGL